MKTGTLLTVDGSTIQIRPENGSDFQLEQLYSVLGCDCIEVVRLRDNMILIIDEEGKLVDKRINHKATALYNNPDDVIVGDALLCQSDMVK